jgi:epsilon-lactone hydrolase
MPSAEHEALVAMLRASRVEGEPSLAERREGYEAMLAASPLPPDAAIEPIRIEHVDADWVSAPGSRDDRVILYLHGGGYVIGSNVGYREFGSRLARATGCRVCVLDYRLAPEHPFPAALEDATMAYRWLASAGFDPGRIVIGGDSAGGGLTLATLLALRQAGDPLPACAVTFSPWTDLAGTGATMAPGAVDDPLVEANAVGGMARLYAGDDLENPLVSPLYGDYAGLPPIQIEVGTREVLLDDSRRVRDRARAAGVDVTYFEGDGLIHVWPVIGAALPESRESLVRVARFIEAHVA